MTGKKTVTPEKVEGEVVNAIALTETKEMEFKLLNPTEDGFLQKIKWNREELEAAVRQKIESYQDVVYTENTVNDAKADRATLNKLITAIEDRRKQVKNIIMEPYFTFEDEVKEVLELIRKPTGMIDTQITAFENQQKEEKKKQIKTVYDEIIGELLTILPFEKVFDSRYLNKTYKLAQAKAEVQEKVERVRTDLGTIDSLESKYKLNAKDIYIKTLDLSKALAENKRLSELEEKLEAENRKKAAEEAEHKRIAEEKTAERKRLEEEQRQRIASRPSQIHASTVPCSVQTENESNHDESISDHDENVTEEDESITDKDEDVTKKDNSAVDPFAPKTEEKKFAAKFRAVGTKEQLEQLIQFMNDNKIEYGRIQ